MSAQSRVPARGRVAEDARPRDNAACEAIYQVSAPSRGRTCNLRIRSPALYPLSYGRWSAPGAARPASVTPSDVPFAAMIGVTADRLATTDSIVRSAGMGVKTTRKMGVHSRAKSDRSLAALQVPQYLIASPTWADANDREWSTTVALRSRHQV